MRDSTGVERAAPVLSAGPGQVTYVIPVGTATGDARITITNSDGAIFTAVLPVENMAPRVFLESSWSSEAPFPAATLTRIRDGQQVTSPLVFPIDLGADSDQLYLSVYGTGFRNRSSLNRVRARIGDIDIPVEYAGPQGQSGGLDQINLKLPRTLVGGGLLELNVAVDGTMIYGGHLQFR